MKFLVVGRGWTGNKVFNELKSRGHIVDIVSHNEAFTNLRCSYDWIVNCAGVTGTPNVDACENDKYNTVKGNTVFPILLQRFADAIGSRFAHFSSGCIYQGEITDIMAEPNFFGSTYSISKGLSDSLLKNIALIFRIRMPFTGVDEQKNYLSKVMKYTKNGKLIDGGKNSLTDLDEAVRVACDLMEKKESGPFNLVNSGAVDMHEIAEIMGVEPEWYTPEEFAAATACGRSNCTIVDSGLMRPVKEALKDAIDRMKT